MNYRLHKTIHIKAELAQAWEFFSDPRNLMLITPPALKMQIASEIGEEMYPGMIIVFKVHPFLSIPLTWITEITHIDKLHMFVDEQRAGPYRLWHHQHFFKKTDQGVIAEDIVDYILPGGPFGAIAHALFVRKQLNSIFDFRSTVLATRFGLVT